MSDLYPSLPVEPLDVRSLSYRFASDAVSTLPAPGARYFPDEHLLALGVTPGGLAAHGPRLQWAMAYAHCQLFILLERFIVDFVKANRASLGAVKSVGWLDEDEQKHIALFANYQRALAEERPGDAARLDALATQLLSGHFTLAAPATANAEASHFLHWLLTLLFEEYTVYLSTLLADVEPTWRQLHSLHAREEAQHLVTTAALAKAVALSDSERREWSKVFVASWAFNVGRLFTFPHVRALLGPSVGLERPLSAIGLCATIRSHGAFKRTRSLNPALQGGEAA